MKTKHLFYNFKQFQKKAVLLFILSIVSFIGYSQETYDPLTTYYEGNTVDVFIHGILVTVEYIHDQPSSTLNYDINPRNSNTGHIWSISKNYSGQWVQYRYKLFTEKATIVEYEGNQYQLKADVWDNVTNPSINSWAWLCLDCSEIVTCSNNYATDYFPIALAKQNNGADNTTPPNASGEATIISGQQSVKFLNINQQRNCNTPLALYNNDIYFRDGCDPHAGLGYYGIADNTNVTAPQKRLFADTDTDGPVLYGWKGGALGVRQRTNLGAINGPHIEKIALQWTPSDILIGSSTLPMNLKTYGPIFSYNIQDTKYGIIFSGTNNARILNVTNTITNQTVLRLYGNGDLRTKKIWAESIDVVANVTWPDFVFNYNYYLRPLNEVESFILVNNHLPDVPSAQEVQENGINVAEMNAILLMKIEELTLYVIELQKQLDATNAKLAELE